MNFNVSFFLCFVIVLDWVLLSLENKKVVSYFIRGLNNLFDDLKTYTRTSSEIKQAAHVTTPSACNKVIINVRWYAHDLTKLTRHLSA